MNKKLNVGDKETFVNYKIELFKAETSITNKAVQQYQKLVLGEVNQARVIKDLGSNLTTLSYPDGGICLYPRNTLLFYLESEALF